MDLPDSVFNSSRSRYCYTCAVFARLPTGETNTCAMNSILSDKLENLCKKARDENTSLCEQLQKEKEQQTRSKSAHGTLQQNFDTLQRDHNSIEQRWQLAQSLRVELSDEEPEALYVTLPIRWWAL